MCDNEHLTDHTKPTFQELPKDAEIVVRSVSLFLSVVELLDTPGQHCVKLPVERI